MRDALCAARAVCLAWLLACNVGAQQEGQILFAVPDIYTPPAGQALPPADSSGQAQQIFFQANEAAEEGNVSAALRGAAQTLLLAPDHPDARRVLGYESYEGFWGGDYAIRQLKQGNVWDPHFGWILPADLPRYERGERKVGKRWISAEEDAQRHDTIDDGWRVRTDHFQVVSNHSLTAAADLAARLEQLYKLWLQQCGEFFLEPAEVQRRFAGNATSSFRPKPFQVVYHRDRAQYNSQLVRLQPRIGITLGIYFDTQRKSHFFAGEDQDPGTLYHEAVHQFFQESTSSARSVGGIANAWAIEGIACYFESLEKMRFGEGLQAYRIGAPQAGRLPAARKRLLEDQYYVPLAELSRLGTSDLQRRSDIARLYSQSAGLATFFMHYENGKYRGNFLKFLQAIYTGRDKPTTLQEFTGQPFEELDRQYRAFLNEGNP